MTLRKLTKWLAIAAMIGGLVAFIAFKEASIQIDGKTISLEELIYESIDYER